mgnify:CR=1 FL=1
MPRQSKPCRSKELDGEDGKTLEEIEEDVADQEAKSRAQVLTIMGDLPDEDVKPPEDTLFVCKLNGITSDEDLEQRVQGQAFQSRAPTEADLRAERRKPR